MLLLQQACVHHTNLLSTSLYEKIKGKCFNFMLFYFFYLKYL